jgi:hypothetical protein
VGVAELLAQAALRCQRLQVGEVVEEAEEAVVHLQVGAVYP